MNDVRTVSQSSSEGPGLALPLACLWLLMLTTFSLPGRSMPADSLDYVALAKVGIRGVTCLVLIGMVLCCWDLRQSRQVRWLAAPLGLLVCWALLSTAWSPLRRFSLGQAGGLTALAVLAVAIGFAWRGSRDTSHVLRHLSWGLLVVSSAVLAIAVLDFEASGLDRLGTPGVMHATSAGAAASLGLLILVASRLLWGWPWSRTLLGPGITIHGGLLLMCNSRSAIGLTMLLLAVMCLVFVSRLTRAWLLLGTGLAGAAYLAFDPGLEWLGTPAEAAGTYLRRGQSADQVSSLTGRTEMWGLMWDSYLEAPLIGHGYFVCSRTGVLDVWGFAINHTAHNLMLQVLVSTGLVGLVLFLWAILRPWWPALGMLKGGPSRSRLASLLALAACWFMCWGQLSESFMGPIQPESVVFFSLFGLTLGSVGRSERQDLRGTA